MTTLASHQSEVRTGRDGFGRLVHAEWTKLRTVRGWVVALLLIPVLTGLGALLLTNVSCSLVGVDGQPVACVAPATGPGGEAVADSFYLARQALAGDGTITARVTSLAGRHTPVSTSPTPVTGGFEPGVQPWSKAGIMISAGTAQGSAYAAMMVTGGNGVRMQWNYTGDSAGLPGTVSASSPRWLRLTRSGDTLTGYDSSDGTHWNTVGSVVLSSLPSSAQIGLFATSPSYIVLAPTFGGGQSQATGTFDRIALTWPGATGRWIGTGIGSDPAGPNGPDPFTGSFTHANDTITVTGSGDIAPEVPETWDGVGVKAQDALTGTVVGLIPATIVAALFVTAEYRRGLIRLTFAAAPRRGRVLAAKAVAVGSATFVAGLVGAAIALASGIRLLSAGSPVLPMSTFTEVRMVVGTAALLAVAAVLALALGTLARRGVTAVTAVIAVIFVPLLLATLPGLLPLGTQEWLLRVTPGAAFAVIQSLPAYHQVLGQYQPAFGYFPLSAAAGFAVLCAWTAAALAAAGYALRRRDV
ncbi:MAG TPA: ABC transporter permease subunit [Actinocrinis sp.]